MKKKHRLIFVKTEKLPPSATANELSTATLAKISKEVQWAMKVEYPAANMVTFIELEL